MIPPSSIKTSIGKAPKCLLSGGRHRGHGVRLVVLFGCHASASCSAPRFSCPPVSGGFSPWFSRRLSRRLCAFYGQPRAWACFFIDIVFASCSSLSLLGLGSRRGLTGVGALGLAWTGVLLLWLLHRSGVLWYRAYAHTLPVCRFWVAHA
jgi:hypothetical protein